MNENWDSEVREDMSDALDRIVPEDKKGNLYRHSAEGPDDMPVGQPLNILSMLKSGGRIVNLLLTNHRLISSPPS